MALEYHTEGLPFKAAKVMDKNRKGRKEITLSGKSS